MTKTTSNFIYQLHHSFLTDYETLLEIAFVFSNAWNIFQNYQNPGKVFAITLALVIIYFCASRKPIATKMELLFIAVLFSVITSIVESSLIYYSDGLALKYGKTGKVMNIPVWLFCAYFSMVIIILSCRRYYWNVVVPLVRK